MSSSTEIMVYQYTFQAEYKGNWGRGWKYESLEKKLHNAGYNPHRSGEMAVLVIEGTREQLLKTRKAVDKILQSMTSGQSCHGSPSTFGVYHRFERIS